MATRAVSIEQLARVLIMQRICKGDLADTCLDEGYEHLCIPFEYVPKASWDRGSSLPKRDPRTIPGEVICPARFPPGPIVEAYKRELGAPSVQAAQLQQNPLSLQKQYVQDDWFGEWSEISEPKFLKLVQSWDFSFKNQEANSRMHGALWAKDRDMYYLLREVIGHMNYPEAKRAFLETQKDPLWAMAGVKLVEDKASGTDMIAELGLPAVKGQQPKVLGIRAVIPRGSKGDRLKLHTEKFEMGLIKRPPRHVMPTTEDFREEICSFPDYSWDDRVDTTTQALDYLTGASSLREALGRMRKTQCKFLSG
jgi:predicted phage terminase large subunit-like protein